MSEPEVYAVGGTFLAIQGPDYEVAAECDSCGWTGTITRHFGALVNHYRHKCGGYILLGTPEERAQMQAVWEPIFARFQAERDERWRKLPLWKRAWLTVSRRKTFFL